MSENQDCAFCKGEVNEEQFLKLIEHIKKIHPKGFKALQLLQLLE